MINLHSSVSAQIQDFPQDTNISFWQLGQTHTHFYWKPYYLFVACCSSSLWHQFTGWFYIIKEGTGCLIDVRHFTSDGHSWIQHNGRVQKKPKPELVLIQHYYCKSVQGDRFLSTLNFDTLNCLVLKWVGSTILNKPLANKLTTVIFHYFIWEKYNSIHKKYI